jgi:hypothetical protein
MIQSLMCSHDLPQRSRYEALRRLVARYELGELSDDDFTRMKKEILRDASIENSVPQPRIEILLATYDVSRIDDAETALDGGQRRRIRGIIDAALITRMRSGVVRIRALPGVTRPLSTGHISVISGICGILFPLDALLPQHAGTPLAASFGAFVTTDAEQAELRSIGENIMADTIAILVVCWAAAGNAIAAALHDANGLIRKYASPELAVGIAMVLSAETESLHEPGRSSTQP